MVENKLDGIHKLSNMGMYKADSVTVACTGGSIEDAGVEGFVDHN